MRLEPGEQIDNYTIVRRLGQGGMGTVYQARDPQGQLAVLKVPFETVLDDPGTQARYQRELEITRSLDHPGIQRLIATGVSDGVPVGEPEGVPYSILEWIDGGLLRDHLYEGRPLAVEDAVRIAVQLCDALQYCHERGIVHRDLKPDNVLITTQGDVKLMDFGAALLEGGRKITTASLSPALGTPDYMSPEQVQGQRGDARSDIYSLGAMLYELLAGAPPFRGDNALAVMAQHVHALPAPVRGKNHQVPPALDAVVAKALRKQPASRYPSMAAFKNDLLHLDRVDPQALAEESPAESAPKRVARGVSWTPRAIAIAAVAAVAAVAVGVAIGRLMLSG